jgi:hypothetical protein
MSVAGQIVVASTFSATPIKESLEAALVPVDGTAAFALYGALTQYLLVPKTIAEGPAAIVLVRVEDWLRAVDPTEDAAALRGKLRRSIDELIEQLKVAARRRPTIFLCCPSQGSVATKRKLVALCQTHSSMLIAAAEAHTSVRVLRWKELPDLPEEPFDLSADRMGQVPFSQECFDVLGRVLGASVIEALQSDGPVAEGGASSPELLAHFYAELELRVEVAAATAEDAVAVAGMARAGTEFRLHRDARTADDLKARLTARSELWRIAVRDRFGRFPQAGFVEFDRGEDLQVRQLVLTCPVLGKQVEHAVLIALARLATRAGLGKISVVCEPGPECELARAFLLAIQARIDDGPATEPFVFPAAKLEDAVLRHSLSPQAVLSSLGPEFA